MEDTLCLTIIEIESHWNPVEDALWVLRKKESAVTLPVKWTLMDSFLDMMGEEIRCKQKLMMEVASDLLSGTGDNKTVRRKVNVHILSFFDVPVYRQRWERFIESIDPEGAVTYGSQFWQRVELRLEEARYNINGHFAFFQSEKAAKVAPERYFMGEYLKNKVAEYVKPKVVQFLKKHNLLHPEEPGHDQEQAEQTRAEAEPEKIDTQHLATGSHDAPPGIGPKQIGQGAAAAPLVGVAETTGQAEEASAADAQDPEPGREPVFFRSRIAKTLGLTCSPKRAGETLRKTLEPDYGFPVHSDTKGNRWNYRDEIEDWKANHAAEIAVLNERKRKPKAPRQKPKN